MIEARALAVEPRDEADARQPDLLAPRPDLLDLDLHLAAGRAEPADAAGGRREAVPRVVQERGVAGRVDEVHLVLLPAAVVDGAGDRGLPPRLLRLRAQHPGAGGG